MTRDHLVMGASSASLIFYARAQTACTPTFSPSASIPLSGHKVCGGPATVVVVVADAAGPSFSFTPQFNPPISSNPSLALFPHLISD